MFHCKRLTVNPVEENCYILWDDTSHEGAVVDCGVWTKGEQTAFSAFVQKNEIRLKYALQTHMHFDHCLGLGFIYETYNLKPLCHAQDIDTYHGAAEMVRQWFNVDISSMLPEASPILDLHTRLTLGDVDIQVLHTPGHTPGGVSFFLPQPRIVFSGDTLFRMGIGRTDLPGGNYEQELQSISSKLFILPEDTRVLPGHGPESTIEAERSGNPYLI